MHTAKKILGSTVIQIVGKFLTISISILIVKILTNYLGLAGFGAYTTIYEFLAFFAIAADFGIFQIAVREISLHPLEKIKIFGNILALRLIFTVTAMAVALGAVFLIPAYEGTAIPLGVVIAALTTFLNLMFGTLSSILQVEMKMSRAVFAMVLGKIVTLAFMLFVVFFWLPTDPQTGFNQLLVAGVLGNTLQLLGVFLAARKLVKISFRFDWVFWRLILRKTLPYGSAILLATIYFRIDVLLLSLMRDLTEVGIYGAAMRIFENILIISVFFLNSALPTLAQFFKQAPEKVQSFLQNAFDFLALLGIPILFGGIVLAYPLISFVAAPEFLSRTGFLGSDVALMILLLALLLAFFNNLFGYTLLAAGQPIKLLWVAAGTATFNFVSNLIVIPYFGWLGATWTSVASETLAIGLGFFFVWKITQVRFRFLNFGKALLAASLMVFCLYFSKQFFFEVFTVSRSLLVLIPCGALIYFAGIYYLKALPVNLIRILSKTP